MASAFLEITGQLISSYDFRQIINEARKQSGEPKVRNDQLVSRIRDELEGELGVCKIIAHPQSGVEMESYDLTMDQCLLVGMRESKAVRRSVRDKLAELSRPAVPQTYAAALLEAGRLAQLAEQQAEQLALAAPKVEFVDQYVEATGLKGFRQVCKLLKANETTFRQFLVDKKIMYRLGGEWTATAQHIEAGRFATKTGVNQHNDHAYSSSLFTPKGVEWIAGEWGKYKLEMSEVDQGSQ